MIVMIPGWSLMQFCWPNMCFEQKTILDSLRSEENPRSSFAANRQKDVLTQRGPLLTPLNTQIHSFLPIKTIKMDLFFACLDLELNHERLIDGSNAVEAIECGSLHLTRKTLVSACK